MQDEIKIPVSKTKILFMLALCLCFIASGCMLIVYTSMVGKIVGVVSILFFGLGFYVFPKAFFDKGMGLIINSEGIIDNLSKPRGILIKWEDIIEIKVVKRQHNQMIYLFVENPEEYLSAFEAKKVRGLTNNYYLCGTPFVIPSSLLKGKLKNVESLLNEELTIYKTKHHEKIT